MNPAAAAAPDLLPGDDCRLLTDENGLRCGTFVTVSARPYDAGPPAGFLVECEFDRPPHYQPCWDDFRTLNLEPLCRPCWEPAVVRVGGELWCAGCVAHLEAQECGEPSPLDPAP